MQTKLWTVRNRPEDGADSLSSGIAEAASLLREGQLVAFPTETVYGLGADAGNTEAVEAIFRAKGRPSDNPLIVHIADRAQVDALAEVEPSGTAERLMNAFWPGPLTLVLPLRPGAVSPRVTAGLDTVAVRMPDHPAALALLRAAGCPVAAPSANRSGRPSPTRAEHVRADLDGAIAGIVDAGPTGVGVESTVARIVGGVVHILRPGGVSAEQLRAHAPRVAAEPDGAGAPGADHAEAPRSPGVKYTHYAPRGRMTLVTGGVSAEAAADWIRARLAEARRAGERTGVLAYAEREDVFAGHADAVVPCGRLAEPETIARELYDALRRCDELGLESIWAEGCSEEGIGAAVMNRLRKACGGREVRLP